MTQPSSAAPAPIAAVILAAGRSTRMQPHDKLLLPYAGRPVLAHSLQAARAAALWPRVLVSASEAPPEYAALAAEEAALTVVNHDAAEGLASSLRTGLQALPASCRGALILLGDMPLIRAQHLRALCAAFAPQHGVSVCIPVWGGQRGNPVLWGAEHFPELRQLRGDRGARGLFERHLERLCTVAMPDDAVLIDVDTPAAYAALPDADTRRSKRVATDLNGNDTSLTVSSPPPHP